MTTRDGAAFPPQVLREYALLADGERGALIGPHGDIQWMCAPQWDSEAVFTALLGGEGVYAVTPTDPRFVWGGYYEYGTLIWTSRWITTTGVIECREALAFPGDLHTAVLLRQVRAVDQAAQVRVVLDPRAGFGREPLRERHREDGIWTARTGRLHVRWSGAEHARSGESGWTATLDLEPAQQHDLVLEISDRPLPAEPARPSLHWEATENAWRRAVPEFGPLLGERDARHSYVVLRGLTSSRQGMIASATTSLPERAEAGRNYDYRYVWIRDQCYAGQAVAADGPHPLLDDAVNFVAARILDDGERLRPAYTIEGKPLPEEQVLDHLTGYPGGGHKIGNNVTYQFQLDALGEALLLLAAAGRHDHLDNEHWTAVETAVGAIEKRWGEPDTGVWELGAQHWAHSRLTCAAGLRAVAAVAAPAQAARWVQLADTLVTDAAMDCLHPSGRWQRSPDDDTVDAALLIPALRGAVPANDPRSLATLAAVEQDLTEDGYVYRFRHDQRPLHEAEGAFLLCGYFMTMATHQQGRYDEARAWFERNRAACGPAALYSEEYDVVQRQLRGNLPQAFVHALAFEAASRLARPADNAAQRRE